MCYCAKNNIVFVPHLSTVSNLLQFNTLVAGYLNNNIPCDIIMQDFSQAFKKVEHPILLNNLKVLHIYGSLLLWTADFLLHRSQCKTYNGTISSPRPVRSGVIQGSVIGPTLFVGFINDLPSEVITFFLEPFADDSKAIAPVCDAIDKQKMQLNLFAIEKWSQENLLPVCKEKLVCLH